MEELGQQGHDGCGRHIGRHPDGHSCHPRILIHHWPILVALELLMLGLS